jgi:hypothetical protein
VLDVVVVPVVVCALAVPANSANTDVNPSASPAAARIGAAG